MIKYFCDLCRKEVTTLKEIEYYCHINDLIDGTSGVYVDEEHNVTSTRKEEYQVCIKCYNETMVPFIKELRKRNN